MIDTKIIKENFTKLSPSEKLLKLKATLGLLKESFAMYEDIYQQIQQSGDKVSDDVLLLYYSMICNNLDALQGDSLEQFMEDLKSFKALLQKDIGEKQDQKDIKNIEKTLQEFGV